MAHQFAHSARSANHCARPALATPTPRQGRRCCKPGTCSVPERCLDSLAGTVKPLALMKAAHVFTAHEGTSRPTDRILATCHSVNMCCLAGRAAAASGRGEAPKPPGPPSSPGQTWQALREGHCLQVSWGGLAASPFEPRHQGPSWRPSFDRAFWHPSCLAHEDNPASCAYFQGNFMLKYILSVCNRPTPAIPQA
jgi:hypothetical protein